MCIPAIANCKIARHFPSVRSGRRGDADSSPSGAQSYSLPQSSRANFADFLVDFRHELHQSRPAAFVGMSYEFAGETQGAPFSAYIVKAKPGQGPPLHKHPYVEVAFTLEGCATITVGDEQREVKAGGIVVIPANTPHRFVNSGNTLLRQIDVHASPKFVQTNL